MCEKSINSLLNNMFRFDSFSCSCRVDIKNVAPGVNTPETTLKLYSDINSPLMFSYADNIGLSLTGPGGGIHSGNVLGQLIALPNGDLDKHIAFINTFGFLFPLKPDTYLAIDASAFMNLINRIKATLRLMNAIAGRKNYPNMLKSIAYLLYTNPISIQTEDIEYTTYIHPYTQLIDSFNQYPDINNNVEVFNKGTYSVDDTLLKRPNPISIDYFNAVRGGFGSAQPGTESPRFKHLFAMYTNLPDVGDELRAIIDFFYHYQTEVGVIREVHYDSIDFYSPKKGFDLSDEMKAALLKIAPSVLAAEINHNISGIHPKYDSYSLTPDWQVDNLLQGLYFSIFYMKPGVQIYKECNNPNCFRDKFFLITVTRKNKKYCCNACARAAASQRFRRRQLEKKSNGLSGKQPNEEGSD